MELTEEQKDMLNGKYGEGTAYAMKIQVAIGESFDAPRMVPITRAHVALSNLGCRSLVCGKIAACGSTLQSITYRKSGILHFLFQTA